MACAPGTGTTRATADCGAEGAPQRASPSRADGGNLAAVKDLLSAIEDDRQPISSVYDARAATEMIASVFESHRVGGPVSFPLKNRRNPLTMLNQ